MILGSWFDFKQKLGGYDVVDNRGQSFTSSQQQRQQYKQTPTNESVQKGIIHNSASNLPMPSPKLQATYITNLLDNNQDTASTASQSALQYLTETRGLTKQTLRKFGVGLGSYQFPSDQPGQHNRFVKADCITFPWIMKASEIQEQESLRGGSFELEKKSDDGEETMKDPFITRRIKARSLSNKGNQRLDPPG